MRQTKVNKGMVWKVVCGVWWVDVVWGGYGGCVGGCCVGVCLNRLAIGLWMAGEWGGGGCGVVLVWLWCGCGGVVVGGVVVVLRW